MRGWLRWSARRRARPDPEQRWESDLDLCTWAAAGRLCAQLMHEMNNALAAVLGHAQIGLASRKPARMVRALETTMKSAERLRPMLQRVSDLSNGREGVGMGREDLLTALEPLLRVLERPLESASIRIVTRFGGAPWVLFNRRALQASFSLLTVSLVEQLRRAGGGELLVRVGPPDREAETVALHIEGKRDSPEAVLVERHPVPEERLAAALIARHGGELIVRREAAGTEFLILLKAVRWSEEPSDRPPGLEVSIPPEPESAREQPSWSRPTDEESEPGPKDSVADEKEAVHV